MSEEVQQTQKKEIKYVYDEFGLIDWKAMIPKSHFGVKKDMVAKFEKKYGSMDDADLSKVEDYYLYIKLSGLVYAINMRGYDAIEQKVDYVSEQKAVCTCKITLPPNGENPRGLICSGVASASFWNVSKGFESFLETLAENRAMARAIRRALRINIVAYEEMGEDCRKNPMLEQNVITQQVAEPTTGSEPYHVIKRKCEENGYTFEQVKSSAAKASGLKGNAETWTTWKDIGEDSFLILQKIEDAIQKKKKETDAKKKG